ncbi:hypothetical protein Pcinc_022682 [Petrolisthes cinctipes]|uniref:YqaJ viral recombinase domain-containing protein n=1 Tax=Petrolisthes cinctipes TaxID=88211 RepID=A0AAE1FDA0_PETCI|nr:hypothetical protein Pcinc_040853 [Petrolisthes cinctipes]KAK3861455.1 hypothetical protein Pcinc_032579 [Petrolisthes cinctipes]KAK3872234.1 hypothetical protein Pcinc_022682 [Petrolisthes cinctipes]
MSRLWFQFRAGKVTASKLELAARTSAVNPSPSLVKAVCYPKACRFRSEATIWGCTHEEDAASQYSAYMQKEHANFKVEKSGLFLNSTYPYLGATPDGVTTCKYCDNGLLKVKCPLCFKDATLEVAASSKSFCLEIGNTHYPSPDSGSVAYL